MKAAPRWAAAKGSTKALSGEAEGWLRGAGQPVEARVGGGGTDVAARRLVGVRRDLEARSRWPLGGGWRGGMWLASAACCCAAAPASRERRWCTFRGEGEAAGELQRPGAPIKACFGGDGHWGRLAARDGAGPEGGWGNKWWVRWRGASASSEVRRCSCSVVVRRLDACVSSSRNLSISIYLSKYI